MDDGSFAWDRIPLQLYLVAAAVLFVAVLVAALLGWIAWRRARRSAAWRSATLRLRAELDPSPARRTVARLRARLDEAAGETAVAVETVAAEGWAVADLSTLARRFTHVADSMQTELALLAREPDSGVVAEALSEAEARVRRALEIGHGIRRAATMSLRRATDDDLGQLHADLDVERRALSAALDELAHRQGVPLLPDQPRRGGGPDPLLT